MSFAPQDLLNCRAIVANRTRLPAVALGIVGDPSHGGEGYHVGWDRLVGAYGTGDYSWGESPRDRVYSNASSALDIGTFSVDGVTLRSLSAALVDACRRGDPRTRDVREVIWSPDGARVRRWDRLGVRSTGDGSHTSHTHVSFFRDAEGRRANSDNFGGLLAELLYDQPTQKVGDEDDMVSLMRYDPLPEVFLVDGLFARHVSEGEIADLRTLSNEGTIRLGYGGKVRVVTRRSLVGRIVGAVPSGWEDFAA